jgi:hypothetical protein
VFNHVQKTPSSPEAPPRDSRLATVATAKDLVGETLVAIIVTKVEAGTGVQVLNLKKEAQALGTASRAHRLGLTRREPAREHAAVVVAGVLDETAGFLGVGPRVSRAVAAGRDAGDAEGENTTEGNEDGGSLHLENDGLDSDELKVLECFSDGRLLRLCCG